MSLSLEYTMFRFNETTVESSTLAQAVVRMCMDEDGDDRTKSVIGHLLEALHEMRVMEADEDADEDEPAEVPVAEDPERYFLDACHRVCDKAKIQYSDETFWWPDHWPLKSTWHPADLSKLARLTVGHDIAFREQCRQLMSEKG